MLSKSLREQVKVRWREFRREPSAFFWVMFMPLVWMLALGFAFSHPHPESYGIGWLAPQQNSAWADEMHELLQKNEQVILKEGDPANLQALTMRGEIALIVSADAEKTVSYKLDTANPEAVRAQKFVADLLERASGRQDILTARTDTITVEGGRYIDFLIPGLLGLSIMTTSLHGIAMTIVSNRKENLLKRYLATPLRTYEYIISHWIGRMVILSIEFAVVMLGGFLVFHFRVFGNYGAFIAFSILGAAAFTSIAMLCAARTRSTPMIAGLTNLISLPMMMLSGVFFSRNNFPSWLRTATEYLPLTALNEGLRKIALEGLGLHHLGFETAILGAYLIVPAILCARLFKWF